MKYDDIIDLPHHISKTRERMSRIDRAAQFAPFAALTGYEDAIRETERLTEQMIELDDSEKERINAELCYLAENNELEAEIRYFEPDKKKDGGEYRTLLGRIRRIDQCSEMLLMDGGASIPLRYIVDAKKKRGLSTPPESV